MKDDLCTAATRTRSAFILPRSSFILRLGLLELDRGGEQREARDHAVGVETVGRAAGIVGVGRGAWRGKGERAELHARRVEVLVGGPPGMHAVEAADDGVFYHVDHRICEPV